jgi:hypothetical protein
MTTFSVPAGENRPSAERRQKFLAEAITEPITGPIAGPITDHATWTDQRRSARVPGT